MNDDFDGATLVDNTGDEVGTIERTYIDDSGAIRFVEVKIGTLLAKHRLVPADGAERDGDTVRVPYTKDTIEESPSVSGGDTLEGDTVSQVRDYYANDIGTIDQDVPATVQGGAPAGTEGVPVGAVPVTGAADQGADTAGEPVQRVEPAAASIPTADTPPHFGEIRDLGDVVEIPIVEEVLVKRPVVREVLRVRKSQFTERGIAAADLRKEGIEVVSSGEGLVSDDSDISDESAGT